MNPIDKAIERFEDILEMWKTSNNMHRSIVIKTEQALEALRGMKSVDVEALTQEICEYLSYCKQDKSEKYAVGATIYHLAAQGYLTRVADDTNDGDAQGGD